ncbi:hypothetical protein [Nonomuraea dietziae]|uniref:hypothetical protein n=1 Tax=Nonomuraea dietziae TaxID=65515 RepID=UPI003423EB78
MTDEAVVMVTSSPWRRAAGSVPALGALQRRLLAALDAVRPGGVVAYVTCSPHLAETGVVVADVLKGRDDITDPRRPRVSARGRTTGRRLLRAALAPPAQYPRHFPGTSPERVLAQGALALGGVCL